MAIHTISNNCLVVTISDHGAELQSLKSSDGKEYLWQGEPEFWARRSPILFPFVGALVNDSYRYHQTTYPSKQHGFARDMDFEFVGKEGSKIAFVLTANEETKKIYPFDFVLTVEYSLFNNELRVSWTVENRGEERMYYSIGAHPAFNLPPELKREECYIQLDRAPRTITSISGRYAAGKTNVKDVVRILPNHTIRLDKELFANDALVFEDDQVHKVSLCTPSLDPFVEVTFDAPVVGIWSPYKKDCPFVCIEPWYGRCDDADFQGTLEERKWQNTLEAGEKKEYSYTITVM